MTYDEFKVVVAKVIEIEYDHWLRHGTPIRKEDAVLVADDVAGEVFIDSAVELARLRAEIDRLRGLLREWRSRHSDWGAPNDLERKTDAALASTNSAPVSSPLTSADQPSAVPDFKTWREHELRYVCEAMRDISRQNGEAARESANDVLAWAENRLRAADNAAAAPQPSPALEDARDAARYRFCEKHGFPQYHRARSPMLSFSDPSRSVGANEPAYYTVDIHGKVYRGATPAEAIDAARAADNGSSSPT